MSRSTRRARFFAALCLLALLGAAVAGAQTINGCEISTAIDWFDSGPHNITFSGCCSYSPPCVKINAGSTIQFSGTFTTHPLNPGFTEGAPPTADPGSPIVVTGSGTVAVFGFTEAGVDPFYCGNHFGAGMFGAVFVALFADGFETAAAECAWSEVVPPVCP